MRRTRWDQKPDNEEPIASSSRWDGNCNSLEWEHHSMAQDGIPDEREHLNSSHPLDYSSDNRQRVQTNSSDDKEKGESPLRKNNSGQSLPQVKLYPPPWSYVPNLQHIYPGSNQNAQIGYHPHSPWGELSQRYYSNADFHNETPFDLEWWDQQRQSLEAHLAISGGEPDKDHQKFEPLRSGHWSFGSRVLKHNDRGFDLPRKYSRFPNGNYDRSKYFKDNRNLNQNSLLGNYNKHRFSKFDSQKTDRRLLSMYATRNPLQNQYRMYKYSGREYAENGGKPQDYSKGFQSTCNNVDGGSLGKKNKSKNLSQESGGKKFKKNMKKKDSAAELARKKALTDAANKLKQTFLAAKKNKKFGKKSKMVKQVHCLSKEKALSSNSSKMTKAQDLRVPKSIPKTGTSLEHDIDIQFSASEWESVGRGEGGSNAVLVNSNQIGSKSNKQDSEEVLSDSESVQTIEEDGTTDNESENSSLFSEDDEEQALWNNQINSTPTRRRHVSETIRIESEPSNGSLKLRRVRSFSTSQVENSFTKTSPVKCISSDLKKMLVKQLLSMDKKSLQELVDNPKSRKAQFMMNHFMSMHRNALSQKLNQLRFKSVSSSAAEEEDEEDEINILQAITTANLETLPSDILHQVKEILDFEANGNAQEMWEEVSFSFSDIFSEFKGVEKVNKTSTDEGKGHKVAEKKSASPTQDNVSDDLDCQIVTPPPKLPATTITIPDSDNEIPTDNTSEPANPNAMCPLKIGSLENEEEMIAPLSSPSLESETNILKHQDVAHAIPPPAAIDCLDHPQNPVPLPHPSSVPHLISPQPLKQPPQPSNTPTPHSTPPFVLPSPSVESKKLRLDIKNKINDESETSNSQETCELSMRPPPRIKVKQERPSPLIECGLCMHPPRSPHTPQCGFTYSLPPPVPMLPGTPQPLGAVPPQRPVPHLASSGIPSIFKQERPAGSYLNLEHINRPSSEERPKNPAPPDTGNSEPPSPLPIPPPQSTLHPPPPPPRPLIFSPEDRFVEPPRPPSPPPPQHSPRIKLERQTPQYICCCMRNECERSNSSRQSADFRRGSTTPQGQLCESAILRTTPHSAYKFESPFISNLRSRTPHNGLVSMYPNLSPNSRCIGGSNGALSQNLIHNNQCLTLDPNGSSHGGKVTVGVQTDKPSRDFAPNLSCARSVTPLSSKTDQTTSTDDLNHNNNNNNRDSSLEDTSDECKHSQENKKDSLTCFVSTSSVQEEAASSSTLSQRFKEMKLSGCVTNQLLQLSKFESEVMTCMDVIEKKERELSKEKRRLKNIVRKIHETRLQNLLMQQSNYSNANVTIETEGNQRFKENNSTRDEQVVSNSKPEDASTSLHDVSINSNENQYMVSSSQEFPVDFKGPVSPSEYFNNSPPHSAERERCISSSLPRDTIFPKESSDSDDESHDAKNNFCMNREKQHNYMLGDSCFLNRNRLNSGSTSEDYQEDKEKVIKKSRSNSPLSSSSNINERETDICSSVVVSSQDKLTKEEENKEESSEMNYNHEGAALIKEEHDHICSLSTTRKGSLTGSPQSPKMRNSSGSEHGYSLRSRGPPSELLDFNSDSQLSKDMLISNQDDQLDLSGDHDKVDDGQADDEFEKEEDIEARNNSLMKISSNESFKRRKRKRKTRYHINKCKKKKDIVNIYSDEYNKQISTCSSSNSEKVKEESSSGEGNANDKQKKTIPYLDIKDEFKVPPPHLAAVLDIKVVGDIIFTTSTDGTARLFDPMSGVILCSYQNHTDSVTSIQVIGEPQFTIDSPRFMVVTGSEDCSIHVYDGKTGVLTQRRNCSEPVRCLSYRWGYLFIGTDGGCGIKWNLKDKKLGEKIQFCGKGITRILTHVEGGRKVLVVGAKTTPIMIRDAMSGLLLRTLEYVQLTMYTAFLEGNLLYTGGTDNKIFVYDYCGGIVKEHFEAEASVSGLMLLRSHYLVATCYDGFVRIFRLPEGNLIHSIKVESSHKMFICSTLFKNKILLGNKNGEIICCELPDLKND